MEDSLSKFGKMLKAASTSVKDSASEFMTVDSPLEKNLKEATANTNWGCSSTIMSQIANSSRDYQEYHTIIHHIWVNLAEKPNKWKRILKTLTLLEYLLKHGSERFATDCRENVYRIRPLKEFHYTKDSVDQGGAIRSKARTLLDLIADPAALKTERENAMKIKDKFIGIGVDGERSGPGYSYTNDYDGTRPFAAPHAGMDYGARRPQHESPDFDSDIRRAERERDNARKQRERQRDKTRRRDVETDAHRDRDRYSRPAVAGSSEEESEFSSEYSSESESREEAPRRKQKPKPTTAPRKKTVDLLDFDDFPAQKTAQQQNAGFAVADPWATAAPAAGPAQQQQAAFRMQQQRQAGAMPAQQPGMQQQAMQHNMYAQQQQPAYPQQMRQGQHGQQGGGVWRSGSGSWL